MLSKRTVVLLVIIIGLILFGIAIYVLKFKLSPERILVEGKPLEFGSVSLHPEKSKVEVMAWFDYPYEPSVLWIEITFIELDVNGTYTFQNMFLNPHTGWSPETDRVVEGSITFGFPAPEPERILIIEGKPVEIIHRRVSEGYKMTLAFRPGDQLGSNFKLRDGNRVDVVLPFYVLKEKVVEGVSFWIDHMYVGELEFSVEVQGEPPPELKQ